MLPRSVRRILFREMGKRQCEKVLYQRKDPDGSLFVYRVISEMKGNYQQRHQRSGSLSGKGTSRCDQCSDRTSSERKIRYRI